MTTVRIYVHAPEVRAARVTNYRNFSVAMAAADSVSLLMVEYFCFPGDGVWELRDQALVELVTKELARLGIVLPDDVIGGFAVRSEKASR